MSIGFIGLGVMGRAMVKNLLRAGFEVVVYDVNKESIPELCRLGAKEANSPKEVAILSDKAIITMVRDDAQTKDVIFGKDGIIEGIENSTIIIMSTITPLFAKDLANTLMKEKGITILDAPVSGGVVGAEEATLSIMVGGSKNEFENCRKILESMGKNIFYCGHNGAGLFVKLANQTIFSVTIAIILEALKLTSAEGIETKLVLDICNKGTAKSWTSENWEFVTNYFNNPGIASLLNKDLNIALKASREMNINTPFSELAAGFDYCISS
ncbi:MAG TPA: 2-hydroxy-3-oxopropionate reductase [Coxiellaceae bacterium]|nr:2-hydroxy-3-oxopropionate reductase [Coxiellaceae bacterium]HBY55578.1 2-hydroxy-3-oxopropionate reductase [Coxiellaceae bacterium]